jgi:hypothetical protein
MAEGKGTTDHIGNTKIIFIKAFSVLVREVRGEENASAGDRITYRVTKYNKESVSDKDKKTIKWAVKIDDRPEEKLEGEGESIEIEMREEWEGKEILVMAYRRKPLEEVSQRTNIKRTLVSKVDGAEEAATGEKANYNVEKYNRDTVVSENIKSKIQWAILIDERQEDLAVKGEAVEIEIRDEWEGKEIFVMAYLLKPVKTVSRKTIIKNLLKTRITYTNMNPPLPEEGPCLMRALIGLAETTVKKNLESAELTKLVRDLIDRYKYVSPDPEYTVGPSPAVIMKALAVLAPGVGYAITEARPKDPDYSTVKAGATNSILGVGSRSLGERAEDSAHWVEGDKRGTFRWDPLSGINRMGRKNITKDTRYFIINKKESS